MDVLDAAYCLLSTAQPSPAPTLLMPLKNPQWSREEIKLLTKLLQKMALVREVQARAPSRRENNKRRRSHTCLGDVLDPQPRDATRCRCRRSPGARWRHLT